MLLQKCAIFRKNRQKMHVILHSNAQIGSKPVLFEGFVHEQIAFLSKKGENGQKVQAIEESFNTHTHSRLKG